MTETVRETIDVSDVRKLFLQHAGRWLLLEIAKRNGNGKPVKLRLIASDPDKERLRELILEDDSWDWSRRYLIVFADPEKPCTI